jgi:hypothetical protein
VTSLGARFDAWLTTPPEEPDSVTTGELREHCDGIPALHAQRVLLDAACGTFREHAPHEFTTHGWDEQHRTCKGCGHDNITIDA